MATYERITGTVLGSSTGTIDFTSIPATYDDLILKFFLRDNRNTAYVNNIRIKFNNDSTGPYAEINMANNATTTEANSNSYSASFFEYIYATSDYAYANIFTSYEMYIPQYANTSYNKTLLIDGSNIVQDSNSHTILWGGTWANTSAINRITITSTGGYTFTANSRVDIYGIKNS